MTVDTITLLLLCCFAFAAGFVDSIVGGGGLIQTPASLVLLPQLPVATVIGSLKIPACTGTAFATVQYLKKIKVQLSLVLLMCSIALVSAFCGSAVLTQVSNRYMKPVILIVLIFVAIYTFAKKDFGQQRHRTLSGKQKIIRAILISSVIGFYDGFIGPGAGSFLVLACIALLGMDFLQSSTYAKIINLSTTFGSIILFLIKGVIIWKIALPMAICNGIGGRMGAKLALAKGNRFIRIFFLIIICATLIRFGYDVLVG
jgi:uncharacterized membrane protein YfcA